MKSMAYIWIYILIQQALDFFPLSETGSNTGTQLQNLKTTTVPFELTTITAALAPKKRSS